jgi:predicted DsbA family dithiol-disulfide isomerase
MFAGFGLSYAPPPEVVPNSRAALRVTELARDRGLHERVHDRLMDAYWSESVNIGDLDALRGLAVEAGLDSAEVDEVLAGDRFLDRVAASTSEAVSVGVTGVPGWVLGSRLLVLGAQPREVFAAAFERIGIGPPADD